MENLSDRPTTGSIAVAGTDTVTQLLDGGMVGCVTLGGKPLARPAESTLGGVVKVAGTVVLGSPLVCSSIGLS